MNATSKGLRVLVAEDNPDCAGSLAMLLRIEGHQVEIARDGPTALESAQTHRPDVLVLDLGLPRLSGYEVAQEVNKQRWEKRPLIIAVTGYGQEADRRHAVESGIDLHFTKPTRPEQLLALLKRFQGIVAR